MYKDLTKILKENEIGRFKINKFTVDTKDVRAMIDGIIPGDYVRLCENNECVMSNTNMEKRTNLEFCNKAYGNILIGGLGIGLILLAIQDKEDVESITVIEKNQEVIDLVAPYLPLNSKVKIICEDVFNFEPNKKEKFDCIYLDIWNWVNTDVYEKEMKPLKVKYRKYLKKKKDNPNRFIKCWAEYQARYGKRIY